MREASLKDFTIVNTFRGFRNKKDATKEQPGVAISGSQNVVIVDGEKIGNRAGFAFVGGRSTNAYGIQGGGSWKTSSGTEIMWRSYYDGTQGIIEVLVNNVWRTLIDNLTTGSNPGKFRSTEIWDTTEVQDLLILVNGDPNLYMWSGGTATFASATTNTVTLQGTDTWAQNRFLTAGTRSIRILDDGGTWREGTYSGGEGTVTLTGVGTDFTAFTISAGNPVLQVIRTTANTPSANLDNDFVATHLNYLFVFDEQNRVVQMSRNSSYTNFTAASSPRLPGEADTITLDGQPTGAITQADGKALYISTKNRWFQITYTPSADLTAEIVVVDPLQTAPLGGATNPLGVVNMKNSTTFVSGEPTIDTLGNVENINTPQSLPLSDPIKNTMDAAGVNTTTLEYYKNNLYIALQNSSTDNANNRILIRNLANGYWEIPWTIPASRIFEYSGELYVHDPATQNTYQLFDSSYSDGQNGATAGAPIVAKWFSSHEDYGMPFNHKKFNKFWVDGYIRPNTKLKVYFIYDFGTETKSFDILGTNDDIIISSSSVGGGLGTYNLGQRNLGSRGETLSASGLKRFRGFIDIPERPFYELQISFQSAGVGDRWEVVEYGVNIKPILAQDNNSKIN